MALLSLRDIRLSFTHPPLLDGISLSIEEGERLCLIGRNGEGKSTLLKILEGRILADEGERVLRRDARVAALEQAVPRGLEGTIYEVVADGLGEIASLLKEYHAASARLSEDGSQTALEQLDRTQQALEAADGWQLEQMVEQMLSRMQLEPDADFSRLSGGMKRRVLLARALAGGPDLLLLDEPTNHLDIESIGWLEEFLLNWKGALVFITHDRGFLRRLATRIVELDRGQLSDYPCDYDEYLKRRAERDNSEALANARFDKQLAQEEAWIRQGIKARRTRNEGRVRQLKEMRKVSSERRQRQGSARLALNNAERSGKLVCEAVDVFYAWEGRTIVRDFSTTILRGDRVGIIGPNGCGKSTLLNLLLGRLTPDSGSIERGTRLEVAYFDQLRDQLELEKSVIDNVAGGSDKVEINGKQRHVISYLGDFLFPPKRCRQPVDALSGGERNRLLLAKLFTRPFNVLVLDEPTNDLDLETLELLEELLLEYQGTLLLVSHDRDFLDNVVTSTLVFEQGGRVGEYVGGYSDWLRQRIPPTPKPAEAKVSSSNSVGDPKARPKQESTPGRPKKRSYKDQRELDMLPERIESLELEIAELQDRLADPAVYETEGSQGLSDLGEKLTRLEQELEGCFSRWEALE